MNEVTTGVVKGNTSQDSSREMFKTLNTQKINLKTTGRSIVSLSHLRHRRQEIGVQEARESWKKMRERIVH